MHTKESIKDVIETVKQELIHAARKFPDFNSSHEGYAVIKEEVDKMWDAIKANQLGLARAEACQVAAMAIRFILDMEGRK